MAALFLRVAILPNLSQIAQAVSISSISESHGPATGQNELTIKGEGFLKDRGETVSQIVAGNSGTWTLGNFAVALTSNNRVFSWGNNSYGALGTGNAPLYDNDTGQCQDYCNISTPTDITSQFDGTVVQLVGGMSRDDGSSFLSTFAITSNGHIYAWGYNSFGELGIGTSDDDPHPTPIDITSKFNGTVTKIIGYTYDHYGNTFFNSTFALTSTGRIYAWGYNGDGELGVGNTDTQLTPVDITSKFNGSVVKLIQSDAYEGHTYALTSTNHVYTWERNDYGQLGNGNTTNQSAPVDITSNFDGNVTQIITGSSVYALTSTNHVYAWGNKTSNEVGAGSAECVWNTTTYQYEGDCQYDTPVDITSSFDGRVVQISGGYALTSTGHVYVWGNNEHGQFGTGDIETHSAPVDITSKFNGTVVQLLVENGGFIYVLTSAGHWYGWGTAVYNYTGDGGICQITYDHDYNPNYDGECFITTPKDITASIPGGPINGDIKQYVTTFAPYYDSSRQGSNYLLTSSGHLYVWGANTFGQLGTGGECVYIDDPQSHEGNCEEPSMKDITLALSSQISNISSIRFGDTKVTNFQVVDDNTIKLTAPEHAAGKVDIILTSTDGAITTLPQSYTYIGGLAAPNTGWRK